MDVGGLPMCSRENGVHFWAHQASLLRSPAVGIVAKFTTLNTSRVCVCLLIFFGWNSLNMYVYLSS